MRTDCVYARSRFAARQGDMAPLARIIDQLKREPSRTGSIVITVFGDAIWLRVRPAD